MKYETPTTCAAAIDSFLARDTEINVDTVRRIHARAVADLGPDLGGGSATDLIADQCPHFSLATIRELLALAGIPVKAVRA